MASLVWDDVGKRFYESGLDRGVLYLPDGSAVPWNGLTAVIEKFSRDSSPIYYDGMKINELVALGDFEATMKAVTYPDEFVELEGGSSIRNGFFATEQPPKLFALCYRTLINNDLANSSDYKIHIVYNLIASPSDITYATISDDPSLVEFEWDLIAIPEEVPGIRPTSHFIMDSRDFDPWLLEQLEEMLYGGTYTKPVLLPMPDLIYFIRTWCRLRVTDNGDGTWTATSSYPGAISFSGSEQELYQIIGIFADHSSDGLTFHIEDACDISDIPEIKIIDNGDGSWTAVTDQDNLIAVAEDGSFNIFNATIVMTAPDKYELSDTML